jgi:putative phosphoribosyl transferase
MLEQTLYADRREAGIALAEALRPVVAGQEVVVLALPRGGVPVAAEVAKALGAPLDLVVVRKLGVPWHPELAMGAVASGGVRVLNHDVIDHLAITPEVIEQVALHETAELLRRERSYRGERPPPQLAGKCVILIDDGLATGSTMHAAVKAVRRHHPARVIVAVPVGPASAPQEFGGKADLLVCPNTPARFASVGQWYADFDQVSDEEVRQLLHDSWQTTQAPPPPSPG